MRWLNFLGFSLSGLDYRWLTGYIGRRSFWALPIKIRRQVDLMELKVSNCTMILFFFLFSFHISHAFDVVTSMVWWLIGLPWQRFRHVVVHGTVLVQHCLDGPEAVSLIETVPTVDAIPTRVNGGAPLFKPMTLKRKGTGVDDWLTDWLTSGAVFAVARS